MDERIIKYCQGELDEDSEMKLLEEAYHDPALKSRIVEYQHLHTLLGLQKESIDFAKGEIHYKLFESRIKRKMYKRLFLKWGRYAAVLLVAMLSSWFLSYWFYQSGNLDLIANQQELNVPAGQRAEVTLPDGTKVWLNANSSLIYPSFFTKERRVYLKGEGFFSVTPNKAVPFIVSTQSLDIRVLGTKFNVYNFSDEGKTKVALLEGAVRVYLPTDKSTGVDLSSGQLLIQDGNNFTLGELDEDELLWKEGIYVFKKQKLGEIIKKLELYFDVNIIVNDLEILDYEYVGKFRQSDGIMTILQIISKIHHFKIEKDSDLNRITLSK